MTDETREPTILVVDDDVGLRTLIERRLEREKTRAVGIESGAEAIEWLGAHRADLMLLDLKLPDMAGDDLLRSLAERKRLLPFVVITGQGDERAAVRMMKRGARDYVMKDGAFLELLPAVVNRVLEQVERESRLTEAEQSLRESQRTLSTLMSNLPGMAYRRRNDREWTMGFVSEGCVALTGYPCDDLIGNRKISYAEIIHREDRDAVWSEVQAAIGRGEPYRLMYRIVAASGEEKWVWEQGRAVLSAEDAQVVGLEGFVIDITERKRAEEALSRSQAMLARAEQIAKIGSWEWNVGADEMSWSEQTYRMFGVEPEQFVPSRSSLVARVHREDRPLVVAALDAAISDGQPYDIEFRIVTPASSPRWVHARGEVGLDEDGRPLRVIGTVIDITDRKRADERLRHSQKLEAVGTLASGVAHDFNNLLTAIFGYTALTRKALAPGHPGHQFLDMADQAIQQASGVTKSLLTFSHKAPTEKSPVALGKVVTESLRLLRRVLPASIEIVEDLPSSVPLWVNADATQLQQVLMNLAVNARDAMPDGGPLRISLRQEADTSTASGDNDETAPPPRALLIVEDAGTGMSEETRSRVFEPFFTTKPRGEGTGLGMAIVHGIVTDHHGRIQVESECGRGTRVTISLPGCHVPHAAAAQPVKPRSKSGRGELILVVEDDAHIRSIVTSMLRSEGYEVIQAADGVEALKMLDGYETGVSLLLLDLDLPKLGGLACLDAARARRADIPAIIVTGNVQIDPAEQIRENVQILRKPFRMSELGAAITHVLTKPSNEAKEKVP